MCSDYKVSLSEYTIIREIMGVAYLNEVRKHTVLTMTVEAMPILEYLASIRTYDDVKRFFVENYEIDESIDEYCTNFINELNELGFLEIKNCGSSDSDSQAKVCEQPYENKVELEAEAIKKQHLLSVTIELTYKCNLQCKHCFVSGSHSEMLDKNFYYTLIDELFELGVLNIVFTGGEVFVRSDAIDIIEYAVNRNFLVDIFTNGTLIDEVLFDRISKLKIHSIQSSIYSSNAHVHDEFVNKNGAFDITVGNLKRFADAGISTAVKTCIFDFNYDDFENLKKLAESINASLQYTMTLLPRKDGQLTPMNYAISYKNMKEFIENNNDTYFYEKDDDAQICTAGQTSISIDPAGKVYMCNTFDMEIGDLHKSDVKEIWRQSTILRDWKKKTVADLKDCKDCTFKNYCDFCPGSAYKLHKNPCIRYEAACRQAEYIYDIFNK